MVKILKGCGSMTYSGALISVQDIQRSKQFYQELFGLKVMYDYGINIAFEGGLGLQQDFDWLVNISKEDILHQSNNFEFCFEEEAFDDFVARLKERSDLRLVHDVKEYPWGQRVIRFYDPDSHIIEVGEAMKMVVKRFLASGLSMEETAQKLGGTVADVELILS